MSGAFAFLHSLPPPSCDTGSPKVCANPGWSPGKARPRCPSAAPCPHLPPSRDLVRTPKPVRSRSLSLSPHCSRDPRSWHQLGPRLPSLPPPRLSFPRPRSAPEAPASFLRLHIHWPTGTPSLPPTRGPPAPRALPPARLPLHSPRYGVSSSPTGFWPPTPSARTPASPAAPTAWPSQSEASSRRAPAPTPFTCEGRWAWSPAARRPLAGTPGLPGPWRRA